MKAIPVLFVVLLTIWFSAVGTEPIALYILSFFALLVSLCVSIFLPWAFRKSAAQPPRRAVGLTICLCILLYVSVAFTHWPLRAALILSSSALEQVANRVRNGDKFKGPQRAGIFTIRKAEVNQYSGAVCLWFDTDSSGNNTGLVRGSPDGQNPWSIIGLGERGHLISQD